MIDAVHPYLNFAGDTEEAFRFYQTVFGGELHLVRFGDFPDGGMGVPEEEQDRIANAALCIGNGMLMATDAVTSMGQELKRGNDFSITINPSTSQDAEALFDALSERGIVEMPLAQTAWAEKYGMCTDRFGIRWMINFQGDVEFAGGQSD